nr:tetrahydrofolate dehydrogenase/cyclohydrolase catalytic domain-containing protein [Mycobacteroides abscessus]
MPATIIDGARVAQAMLTETREQAAEFHKTCGRKPCLATVLVGDDPASHTYVRMKTNRCRSTGLESRSHQIAAIATTSDVVDLVPSLSAKDSVDGILVPHPMPAHVDERADFEPSPSKDPISRARLLFGQYLNVCDRSV